MKKLNCNYCFYGLCLVGLISCVDINLSDLSKDVKFQQSLIVPVGESSITVGDLLNSIDDIQGHYFYNADSVILTAKQHKEYIYDGTNMLKNATPGSLSVSLGNTPTVIPANSSVPILGSSNYNLDLGLNPNSTTNRTDSAKVLNASIGFRVNVTNITDQNGTPITPSDLKIKLTFNQFTDSVTKQNIVQYIPVNQFGTYSNLDISNFTFRSFGQNGIQVKIDLVTGNRTIKTGSNANINIDFTVNEMRYWIAYGQYDPMAAEKTVLRIPVDVLQDIPIGIRYMIPRGLISVSSNIGTYVRFDVDHIKALSKGQPVTQASFNGQPGTSEIINEKPSKPSEYATRALPKIDNNYGGIDKLFDTDEKLDTIEYKFSIYRDAALNNASPTPEFVLPHMNVKLDADLQIPLYFKAGSRISVSDTISIDSALNKLQEAVLALKVTNGLPLKISLSFKFLNADNSEITSTINDLTYVINSAEVNNVGLYTAPTITNLKIELSKEQTLQLQNAKSLVYTVKGSGQDETKLIQITKNNTFKVNVGVFGKAGYETTLGQKN